MVSSLAVVQIIVRRYRGKHLSHVVWCGTNLLSADAKLTPGRLPAKGSSCAAAVVRSGDVHCSLPDPSPANVAVVIGWDSTQRSLHGPIPGDKFQGAPALSLSISPEAVLRPASPGASR